uniref:Uncharacterized protein n=1 Tax=Strongyloides papillosus TaxID=174720 RepID=A0A0N5BMV0_STREA
MNFGDNLFIFGGIPTHLPSEYKYTNESRKDETPPSSTEDEGNALGNSIKLINQQYSIDSGSISHREEENTRLLEILADLMIILERIENDLENKSINFEETIEALREKGRLLREEKILMEVGSESSGDDNYYLDEEPARKLLKMNEEEDLGSQLEADEEDERMEW